MNKKELFNRFQLLTDVLRNTYNKGYFSPLQRTCLHQERSAILKAMDIESEEVEIGYQVSEKLEKIIRKVIKDFDL